MGLDDELGPWWTRPPEPGPESAATQQPHARPVEPARDPFADPFAPPPNFTDPATDPPEPTAAPPEPTEPTEPTGPPAPAEPPAPKRPAIRRVAVVPPGGFDPGPDPGGVEPGSARRELGRTETLPPVQDDIFAVFAGPGDQPTASRQVPGHPTARSRPPAPEPDPRSLHPLGHLRDEPEARHLPLPGPRVLLIGAAVGLVVLVIVIIALVTGGGGDGSSVGGATGATATTKPRPTGQEPKNLRQLNGSQAMDMLAQAGQGNPGTIVEAWDWQDRNGHNLVVTTTSPAGHGKQDLKVIQLARLDQEPEVLRIMRDPNLPADCSGGGTVAFTASALQVRDLNDDGIAEVTAGWTSRCGATDTPSVAKLALLSNGKKYIIRGDGVIGRSGDANADPRRSKWPSPFYRQASTLFHKLYY